MKRLSIFNAFIILTGLVLSVPSFSIAPKVANFSVSQKKKCFRFKRFFNWLRNTYGTLTKEDARTLWEWGNKKARCQEIPPELSEKAGKIAMQWSIPLGVLMAVTGGGFWVCKSFISLNDQLLRAAFWEHSNVVQQLLDDGAAIEAQDKWGTTPLMNAVSAGNLEVVQLLLDKGANRDVTDVFGRMAVDLAKEAGYDEIVEILHGLSQNKSDQSLESCEETLVI